MADKKKEEIDGRPNESVNNPFAELFTEKNEHHSATTKNAFKKEEVELNPKTILNLQELSIHRLVLDVLRLATADQLPLGLADDNRTAKAVKVVVVPDLSLQNGSHLLENLNTLLFERLMLSREDIAKNTKIAKISKVTKSSDNSENDGEQKILHYLYMCFNRLCNLAANECNKAAVTVVEEAIVEQACNFVCNPEIYPESSVSSLILDLLDEFYHKLDHGDVLQKFLTRLVQTIEKKSLTDPDVNVIRILEVNYYSVLCKRFEGLTLFDASLSQNIGYLDCLTAAPVLCKYFIQINSPWRKRENMQRYLMNNVRTYGMDEDILRTLLGRILSISCLPKPGRIQFEYFLSPSSSSPTEHQATAKSIAIKIKDLVNVMHAIFLKLLKPPEIRNDTLNWIGLSLYAFRDRSKMWTNEMMMLMKGPQLSDGFLLNLANLLLLLCQPFSTPYSQKLLKIDPRYCKSNELPLDHLNEDHSAGIHMRGLKEETFLVTLESEEPQNIPSNYNFMTEIFYCTHKAIQMSFGSCQERFRRIAGDLDQIHRMYEDASRQGGAGSDILEEIRRQMDKGMTMFLNLKAMLFQPDVVEMMSKFHIATATWLTNLAMTSEPKEAMESYKKVLIRPDAEEQSTQYKSLSYIPEFVMDNISECMIAVRRFNQAVMELATVPLEPLMTLIVTFMGSSAKMKNPHSRAKLAEVLEALMPRRDDFNGFMGFHANSFSIGEKLFTTHPQVQHLIPTLLHVFVSIEMTGQSVAFEQKFQYRRPMYQVLNYLWKDVQEPHRQRMKQLADQAEERIEDANPPLFLRFVNLLTNDAIFLLDEALDCMSKLREMQQQRSSGAWSRLPRDQRESEEANYHHLGRNARFYNVIGCDTIHTLSYITEEITSIFCHHVMVQRIASMLNYFLLHLVGPKKKNLKVKDMETEYDFKPADIVRDICLIYFHLGSNSNSKCEAFRAAVLNDSRSYNPQLLPAAADVLIRTGKADGILTEAIKQLGSEINKMEEDLARDEIPLSDVPEDFLDSIMNTLMTDPIILPSGYRLDRSTIARHLLSDQTDPFTRQPLTMDKVVPDVELKTKIEEFIKSYQEKRKQSEKEIKKG